MYLHLLYDKKFAKSQIGVFEKYYPGQSLYVFTRGADATGLEQYNIMFFSCWSIESLNSIKKRCWEKIEAILVYNATDIHCVIALYVKRSFQCRVYWMFFGSDLYDNLYYRYNFPLIDNERKTVKKNIKDKLKLVKHWPLFRKFAAKVDYFCFWNVYDYELLTKYVNTPAKFKFYTHGLGLTLDHDFTDYKTYNTECLVQINHSASWDGNHLTLLKRLAEIDSERKAKLLLPLSYGSKSVVNDVERFVAEEKLNAQLLKDFLPRDDYFKVIDNVTTAIYGQHRQEGGGNLVQAFQSGAKVFLREDCNLLQLYRDWGLKVYSFEKDLKSLDDLITPLSREDQENNYIKIVEGLSRDKVDESMRFFFEE